MDQKIVAITGAFGILGSAVSDHFADLGWKVARIDYAPAPKDEEGYFGGLDLTNQEIAEAAWQKVLAEIGKPNALVNIAGGFVWEKLSDGGPGTWERMFRMNTLTAVTMCKVALDTLAGQPGAAIVNIGAGAAANADAGMGAYAASKAGVARLTESLAAELAGKDVTVNAILPTIIDTPTNRADMPDADFSSWVQPREIARVIAFLASDEARAITGASIPVSRGTA
ncbi:SDR family NAD(P)-dependent oxidoreductase [Tsuneonella mangrovi]|uniref:SDR family NAD(P)-dependent oxidoreductase n=1 Tax=Tsuneonella mangrovi TaxID=1982042 RepID=UPI000BA28825|nr:SDR family NAD(P)-dependent oxidoreductase [Tsuneonella mangrovi]